MRITNNERTPKILGKFKLSLILALVAILPLSAIFGAVLQGKSSSQSGKVFQQSQSIRMLKENRKNFDTLVQQYDTNIRTRSIEEQQELEQLTTLGYHVLDMMDAGVEYSQVFDYFMAHLNDEQQYQVVSIIGKSLGNEPITYEEYSKKKPVSRGWYNTHLVLAMTVGYAAGFFYVSLLSWSINLALAAFGVVLGPFVLILGFIIGTVLGGIVESIIDNAISNNGYIPGFRIVIATIGIWWFWGGGDADLNILDILFFIAGKIGGTIARGNPPAGSVAPSWA